MRSTIGLLALALCTGAAFCAPAVLHPIETGEGWARYDFVVTLTQADAPDCFQRPTVRVSGLQSPSIIVEQGTMIYVNVHNDIPQDYPQVVDGIIIHWHGFAMYGAASWYDGVPYVDTCPIQRGDNFTYAFRVDEHPGTYFWHDHQFAHKADGLFGALIVTPKNGTSSPWEYDGDHIMLLSDFYHTEANALAMGLNRPLANAFQTPESGKWNWVGNPQAILLNNHGFYADCELFAGSGGSTGPPTCDPKDFTVAAGRSAQQPWASAFNPGCTHASFDVEAGKTYRVRLINAAALVYITVCFGGHNVTVVAADVMPVTPFMAPNGCVDVNVGQRLDVLVTADQPIDNYWVMAQTQYRPGSPAGYAVLHYANATAGAFPNATAAPQPNAAPWPIEFFNANVTMAPELMVPAAPGSPWATYNWDWFGGDTYTLPTAVTRNLSIEISQPLIEQTGQLRWALNNIMTPNSPMSSCDAIRLKIEKNPHYLEDWAPMGAFVNGQKAVLNQTEGPGDSIRVLENFKYSLPEFPTVGMHTVSLKKGAVITVVLQNNAAGAFNGDYNGSGFVRTAQEQHPIHIHGHHFWLLGHGLGVFDPENATQAAALNTVNPPLRDTVTLPADGYTVLRFVANNPGAWPLHCHILWHQQMGQQLLLIEAAEEWTPSPKAVPKCPYRCQYVTGPFNTTWVNSMWGATGYGIPPSDPSN
ncbi:hypothetical protein FOA52_005928 [Chlamydomonas sp. UWO 241]|nr:hypothetical protein FOA52_005928 [Chlamydomonas sp. UWO 241]